MPGRSADQRKLPPGRPESPITLDGPVADLARALRRLRDRAGKPGYRKLAKATSFSSTTLSAAAAGETRPSLDVAQTFARACGADAGELAKIETLWEAANEAHLAARKRQILTGRALQSLLGGGLRPQAARRPQEPTALGHPRPDPAGTAQDFVRQLCALRVWVGQPGYKRISSRAGARLPRSTMYDVLNQKRTTLPPLDAVQIIVAGCTPEAVDEWAAAWRAIKYRELGLDRHLGPYLGRSGPASNAS